MFQLWRAENTKQSFQGIHRTTSMGTSNKSVQQYLVLLSRMNIDESQKLINVKALLYLACKFILAGETCK